MSARDADVVVVGAGLSGVATARALHDAGLSVVLLEARDRVGGRTLSPQVGGATFDLGGQWLGARQPRLAALAARLGLATFPTFHEGKNVLDVEGRVSTYAGTIPRLGPHHLLALHLAERRLDRLTATIPPGDPLSAPDAAALDATSAERWAERLLPGRVPRRVLEAGTRVVFGAELRELSLLHFLHYLRQGHGLRSLVQVEGGAQAERFVDGAQALSVRLAAPLAAAGWLRLEHPVHALEQDAGGLAAHHPGGTVRARLGVVALPPALAVRIAYRPALPVARDLFMQRAPMGATVKCLAFYDRPFWRARGLSGELVATSGPVSVAFDNTSADGRVAGLVAFVVGDAARTFSRLDAAARRDAVLEALARGLGPEARRPGAFLEQDWCAEPWSRGCPVGVLAPGVLTAAGRGLAEPVGRLHFAGTETAREWAGYLEGALEAAERVTAEVRARLEGAPVERA